MSADIGPYEKLFGLYARYNHWFNKKLLKSLAEQPADSGCDLQQAAAGSILRQLNHIFVIDLVWLHRFKSALDRAGKPEASMNELMTEPYSMSQILYWRFQDMIEPRARTDSVISHFTAGLTQERCEMPISFRTLAEGETVTRPLWALLLHLFNHQSLHRGEIIAQLAAMKIDIGATDVLPLTTDAAAG